MFLVSGSWFVVGCRLFVVGCRWSAGQIPNPKHQAPEKSQAANPKRRLDTAISELGIWNFFGIWVLVFGVSIRIPAPGHIRCSAFEVGCSMFVSFITQRLHRIDLARPPRWQPAGRQSHDDQKQNDGGK